VTSIVCVSKTESMGLFNKGPDKVISDGQRVRGRIVGIDVSEVNQNDSPRRVDEYVVETSVTDGGRRLGLRQDLSVDGATPMPGSAMAALGQSIVTLSSRFTDTTTGTVRPTVARCVA